MAKLKLFWRAKEPYCLIVVEPDGKLYKFGFSPSFYEMFGPCYAPLKYQRRNAGDQFIDHWAKYPTQDAAIRAMKKYDSDVELVGEL